MSLARPKHGRPEAFAWMALAATLFAVMNLFARIASEHAHWAVVAAFRAFVGVLVAAGIARARGVRALARPTRVIWMRSIFGTLALMCSFFAVTSRSIPLADAVTLNNTTPLMLALLAPWIINERSGRRILLAVPVATAGVLLLLRPVFIFGTDYRSTYFARDISVSYRAALVPAAVAITGALFSALAMLALRVVSADEPPEAIAAHFSFVAFVVCGSLAVTIAPLPSREALVPMVLAGVAAGIAQVAMTRSYSLEPAARVGTVGNLQVVVASALGALVLREPLPLRSALAISLVLAAGLFLSALSVLDARRRCREIPLDS